MDRPVLHCLIAYWAPPVVSRIRLVPLDEAVDYQRLGWSVLIDPEDEATLTRYEQLARAGHQRSHRKWFET